MTRPTFETISLEGLSPRQVQPLPAADRLAGVIPFVVIALLYLLWNWLGKHQIADKKSTPTRDALDTPLLFWTPDDPFTVRDLLNGGVSIIGRTGSGKTSSSGRCIAEALISFGTEGNQL